jgi:DNA-binding MarR family transcriptional regulator
MLSYASAMTRWLDDDEQHAWRALLAVNAQLTVRMNRGLQESSGLSLSDYDVLVALTDVPEGSVRMRDLGRTLQWEKSRVSKQVSRMAARGLVVRQECADDLRGSYVDLTDAGRAAIEAAAPDHVELVRDVVFDGLTAEQLAAFSEALDVIRDRLELEG